MGLFGRTTRFQPDGYYNEVPYRAAEGGTVEAVINGEIRKFRTVEAFIASLEDRPGELSDKPVPVQAGPFPSPVSTATATGSAKQSSKVGCGCLSILIVGAVVVFAALSNDPPRGNSHSSGQVSSSPAPSYSSTRQRIVDIINEQFGGVCSAKLEGFWSDTLRIDWKSSTTKLHSLTVFAAIGQSKQTIYDSGIRYLKFPNDVGGYNIIDWKTGEKSSIDERAPYYF